VRRESEFADTVCEYAANASLKGGKDTQTAEEEPDRTTMKCRFEHNLRSYLQHKSPDLDGVCAVYQSRGVCASGWRCKWLSTHTKEENGELLLVIDEIQKKGAEEKAAQFHAAKVSASKSSIGSAPPQDWEESVPVGSFDDPYGEVVNNLPTSLKISIRKNQIPLKRSEVFQAWANEARDFEENRDEHRAEFREPPPRPEEKRRLYISRDTPLLAPLTYSS
jgi:tRNA-dihydrouridine synthase 3